MEQLQQLIDVILFVLILSMILVILLKILPNIYKAYQRIEFQADSDTYSKFSYFTDGSFWQWVMSKEGRIGIYQDSRNQRTMYYNNFKLFNWIWKLSIILLTFRVLLILFGSDIVE